MRLFGPSKKELSSKLEAMTQDRDSAIAERERFGRELYEWKRDTLDPQVRALQNRIKAQQSILDSMGALDHFKRTQEIEHIRAELAILETTLVAHRTASQLEMQQQSEEIARQLEDQNREASRKFADRRADEDRTYRELTERYVAKQHELKEIERSVVNLNESAVLQDLGFFEYDSVAKSSVELGDELARVRSEIKEMLKASLAASVTSNFSFNGSDSKGRKFANDMRKLMLRAYNAEAENAIKSIRAGNKDVAIKRLNQTKATAEGLGKFIDLSITDRFHGLRIREIELANEHLQTLQREKELEREHKAQLREEAKAEAEVKKARVAKEAELKRIQLELEEAKRVAEQHKIQLLEKERDHYENVAESPEVQSDQKTLASIQAKLEDAKRAIADLDYREANLRAGYVYVLSNIGAFGRNIVKIGMTRRLEPHDRVKELSGASVPFVFDTHLMVFADDARGLEHRLHKHFSEARVNRVNPRKEYFYTTPEEVLRALKEMDVAVVEFTEEAAADEYRAGLRLAPSSE